MPVGEWGPLPLGSGAPVQCYLSVAAGGDVGGGLSGFRLRNFRNLKAGRGVPEKVTNSLSSGHFQVSGQTGC